MGGDFMYRNLAILLTTTLILTSCAGHQFNKPESIEAKMSRFENKSANTNEVPKLGIYSEGIEKVTVKSSRGRAPASVEAQTVGGEDKVEASNKKLYFMSLFSQYERLRKFAPAGSTNSVNVCPSFHSGLVEFRSQAKKSEGLQNSSIGFNYNLAKLTDTTYLSQYPELGLPLSDDVHGPSVASIISSRPSDVAATEGNRLMSQAIHQHASRMYREISELCETGTSTNYYNFENLLTHARTHRDLEPSEYGLQILMKTTIVSNMVLIESIQGHSKSRGRAPASVDLYTDEALERLGTPWAYEFIKSMVGKRR